MYYNYAILDIIVSDWIFLLLYMVARWHIARLLCKACSDAIESLVVTGTNPDPTKALNLPSSLQSNHHIRKLDRMDR